MPTWKQVQEILKQASKMTSAAGTCGLIVKHIWEDSQPAKTTGTVVGITASSASLIIKGVEEIAHQYRDDDLRGVIKSSFNMLNRSLLLTLTLVDALSDNKVAIAWLIALYLISVILDIATAPTNKFHKECGHYHSYPHGYLIPAGNTMRARVPDKTLIESEDGIRKVPAFFLEESNNSYKFA